MPIWDNYIKSNFKVFYLSSHSFNTSKTPTKTSEIDFGQTLFFFLVTIFCEQTSSNPSFSASIHDKTSGKCENKFAAFSSSRARAFSFSRVFSLLEVFFARCVKAKTVT